MKGIDLVSDIEMVLKASRVSKDSRINRSFIHHRMCVYAGEAMRQSHARNGTINPQWVSDLGAVAVTAISSSEVPGMIKSGYTFGKFQIPGIVAMKKNQGIRSIFSLMEGKEYFQLQEPEFRAMLRSDNNLISKLFNYFFHQGNYIYVYPYIDTLRVKLILEDPRNGYVMNTHRPMPGELIPASDWSVGEEYIVESGSIVHNGITYNAGQFFTAQNKNYTGNGVLMYKNKKRSVTLEDEYPMTTDIFEEVCSKIWMKDFALEKQEIADIKNDNTDQLHLAQG